MKLEIFGLLAPIILKIFVCFGNPDENHQHQQPTDFKNLFKEWEDSNSIRKSRLKVYGMNYPPVLIPITNNDDTCINNGSSQLKYKGTSAEVVDYIAQHYELNIEYVQEDPSEVAKFGQVQALVYAVLISEDATSGAYKVLGDTLRQNPELLFSKYPQAVENVLKYNAANADAGMIIALRIGADMKMNGTCRLTASNPIFHTQSYSYILPKNSRYTKAVDRDLWRLMEAGLVDHWKKVYIPSIGECDLNTYQNSKKKQSQ